MMQEAIQIGEIRTVSPSLAEILSSCLLRAGLSRSKQAMNFVLGNPKAWLGTAYHAALEAVDSKKSDAEFLETVSDAWDKSIQSHHQKAQNNRLDKRFGSPESWPGYHIVAAMALVRAKELRRSSLVNQGTSTGVSRSDKVIVERKFYASEGRLVGSPDLVRKDEVVDYKSGQVFEDDNATEIKEQYIRQLRIYGFLVFENLGWWPQRGILLPMNGPPAEVTLNPSDCTNEAERALQLLSKYNQLLSEISNPKDLANPSAETCRWCPYQTVCPAFWSSVTEDWSAALSTGAIEGKLVEAPRSIHGGSAYSLSITIERGSTKIGEQLALFPLEPSVHPDLLTLMQQDRVRITGLLRRADGSLIAGKRSLIARINDIPEIEFSLAQ